jgi:hypothetical protein
MSCCLAAPGACCWAASLPASDGRRSEVNDAREVRDARGEPIWSDDWLWMVSQLSLAASSAVTTAKEGQDHSRVDTRGDASECHAHSSIRSDMPTTSASRVQSDKI